MDSNEDDYMSDKLLKVSKTNDVRPGLLFNNAQKRSLEQYKKQQRLRAKKPKSYREQEKEQLEKGLNTAISAENKGFQLLAKMGFKEGTSLGKSQKGLVEPINIVVKQDSSGIGVQKLAKRSHQDIERKNLKLKQHEQRFKAANMERNILSILTKDFYKAQRICEELDFRQKIKKPKEEYFWTKEAIKKLKDTEKESDEDNNEDDDEDYDNCINESNLFEMINYLRGNYYYCLYCAFSSETEEELTQSCPGPYRADHDDL